MATTANVGVMYGPFLQKPGSRYPAEDSDLDLHHGLVDYLSPQVLIHGVVAPEVDCEDSYALPKAF